MIATETPTHIRVDAQGIAWVDDTNTKVIEIALDWIAHGSSPEEIRYQHPHLSLSQIHAAFAYYYDHQAELDADIDRRFNLGESFRAQNGLSPIVQKLRALGKLE